jgi:hypothetical protein
LIYYIVIWYIFPVLVCCTKRNLATLNGSEEKEEKVNLRPFRDRLTH